MISYDMEDTATQTPLRSILWRGEVVGRPPPPPLGRTRVTFTSAAAAARRTPLRHVSVMQRPPHQLTHALTSLSLRRVIPPADSRAAVLPSRAFFLFHPAENNAHSNSQGE